jgi:hypothetical protein
VTARNLRAGEAGIAEIATSRGTALLRVLAAADPAGA